MIVWVLLPAFNEELSLPRMLPKIDCIFSEMNQPYRILVVNDGSTDNTAEVLCSMQKAYPIDVLTHKINRGLGETERDGFEYVAEHAGPCDIVVRMDCDDTHEPRYIRSMIEKIGEGFDVAIASRFEPGGGQVGLNAYRTFVSSCANLFMKVLFTIPNVKDYSCGFRAYRCSVIKAAVSIYGNGFIQLKGLGFTSTLETIIKLKLLGCRFAETAFVLRYDQKASVSKMVSSVTTLGYFAMAILYHWPWGGWRYFFGDLAACYQKDPGFAVDVYRPGAMKRSSVCRIGGG